MLELGTQEVSALYLGDTKIKRAYLGEKLVFEGSKPSRLPEGYTEVEYVQTNGNIIINTNLKPAAKMSMVMDVEQTESTPNSAYLFYALSYTTSSGTKTYRALRLSLGGTRVSGYMGSYTTGTDYTISNDNSLRRMNASFDYNTGRIAVDNDYHQFGIPSFFPNNYIFLLGDSTTSKTKAKLYSCKFKTGENLIRDFVPCINPSGVVGLYDLINGGFIKSASTTPLTAGPPV